MNTESWYAINVFFRATWGPLLILAGSVSQLSAVSGGPAQTKPLYNDVEFMNSVLHVQPRLVNFSQQRDPEFGESLSLMQYNKMSLQSATLLKSRALVTESGSMDPTYDPSAVRVFNSNDRRDTYIENCASIERQSGHVTYVSPIRVTNTLGKKISKEDFLAHVKSRFPKLS